MALCKLEKLSELKRMKFNKDTWIYTPPGNNNQVQKWGGSKEGLSPELQHWVCPESLL